MSYRSLLDKTCTIKRASATADGLKGEGVVTWTTLKLRWPCRVQSLASNKVLVNYDKSTTFAERIVYIEYFAGIKEGDRLTVGTLTLEIKMVIDWDEQARYTKLACVEVR